MSEKTNPDKLSRMGRRRFLSTLSALGVSATTLEYITQDALAETVGDLKNEIPYVARLRHTNHEQVVAGEAPPEYEPKYKTMPRHQWAKIEAVHNAADRLCKKVNQADPTGRSYVEITERVNGGVSENVLNIVTTKSKSTNEGVSKNSSINAEASESAQAKIRKQTPSSINGKAKVGNRTEEIEDIPITTEVVEQQKLNYYDYEYDPVPSGAMIDHVTKEEKERYKEGDEEAKYLGSGTICTPGYVDPSDPDKPTGTDIPEGTHLVTAAHVIEKDRSVSQPGTDMDSPRKIGNMTWNWKETIDGNFDAGTITLDSDISTLYDMAADGTNKYEGYTISGYITFDEIKSRAETGREIEVRGSTSGILSSKIHSTTKGGRHDRINAYRIEEKVSPGDSGGPHYDVRYNYTTGDYEAYIAGHSVSKKRGKTGTLSTAMEEVVNLLNVKI